MRTNPSRWRASRRGLEVAVDASSLSAVVFVENMIGCRPEAQYREKAPALDTSLLPAVRMRTMLSRNPLSLVDISVDPQH
jgi:hypothetical protein